MYKFHEEKNRDAKDASEQKSVEDKFKERIMNTHEQNQFHEEKHPRTSSTSYYHAFRKGLY